ncbi:hypothetical protein GCM10010124_21040 [Pilimelia terevasa]|uniref:PRC-barrel domain-containing protein n=1 Tax=Pilimelia terevasa TaxID=53372 RepID=A0A8J3FJ95_9ACTN|nr:PRC-barrel domain-containing protein [Pilimelia terevasa]GGK28200.1 hypothetical protein GCM10010124_21040 [Pilimelia terevasa]
MTERFTPYAYRADSGFETGQDLSGYDVEATDGSIGSIDDASEEVDAHYVVVDTGPWIFGKKVMLPAGTINRIDHADKKVFLDRTKDQVKASPEYDEDAHRRPEYRDEVGSYYDRTYQA